LGFSEPAALSAVNALTMPGRDFVATSGATATACGVHAAPALPGKRESPMNVFLNAGSASAALTRSLFAMSAPPVPVPPPPV